MHNSFDFMFSFDVFAFIIFFILLYLSFTFEYFCINNLYLIEKENQAFRTLNIDVLKNCVSLSQMFLI